MRQLDLFAPRRRPPTFDEARLLDMLRKAEPVWIPPFGFSRAQVRRLMRPLPPITVPR